MLFLAAHENSKRGMFDFPLELYNVNSKHTRYLMPLHWHIDVELIRVISGTFDLTVNDKRFSLKSGDAVFIPSGAIHGGTPENCVYQCVVFSFDKMVQANTRRHEQYENELVQSNYIPSVFQNNQLIDDIFNTTENPSTAHEFIVLGLILQLIGQIIAEKQLKNSVSHNYSDNKRINRIKAVLRLIRKNYDRVLTLEMLADNVGVNPQYLCKSFKKTTGKTPIDYLNYYRIECAAEMLCSSKNSVTEISLSCGFNDLSYFIKMFKRQKGVSPREYRETFLISY